MSRPTVLALGEILWDLLPSGKQPGGAPANFAFHAGQLGADAVTVSAVGDDADGREILERLRALGLRTDLIAVDPHHPTGTVTVALDAAGVPSYTIHEGVAWDFVPETPALLELVARADCVCFGSLAQRSPATRATIRSALAATRPGCLRVFDINLRQHYFDRDVIEESLGRTTVLKLNDQELPVLGELLGMGGEDLIGDLVGAFGLRLVAVTRGGRGAVLYGDDGAVVDHPGYPAEPMADTVGAGDAFTAVLAIGLL
ncbi:MAG TPA: carbohydrate kinase, partial [Tepidisphaeraceae bacterium]|nr:carbohydrate kinase [Tepidisphaeraceae bacterium]